MGWVVQREAVRCGPVLRVCQRVSAPEASGWGRCAKLQGSARLSRRQGSGKSQAGGAPVQRTQERRRVHASSDPLLSDTGCDHEAVLQMQRQWKHTPTTCLGVYLARRGDRSAVTLE
eukprot:9200176-Pyramimonas_sp.AAC.1